MSSLELKSQIVQWIEAMPADKLEQVMAFVAFLRQSSTVLYPAPNAKDAAERRAAFKRHCGAAHSGKPNGADNDAIDADLAQTYAS